LFPPWACHHRGERQLGAHVVAHPLRSYSNDASHRRNLGLLRRADDLAGLAELIVVG
jgi:hypothetical protein